MKQSLIIRLFLLAGLFTAVSGFTWKSGDYEIAVAVAYAKKDCNGLSVYDVKGFDFSIKNPNQSPTGIDIQRIVANRWDIPIENVHVKKGYGKRWAAIISYNYEVSGWGCRITEYAVGFGNSSEESLSDAIKQKNYNKPSASHSLVRYIDAEY